MFLFPFQLLVLSVFLKKIFTPLTELHRTALIKEHRTFCLYPRHGLLAGGGLPAVMASQTSETARSRGRYRVFSSAGPKGFPYRYTVHGDTGSNLPSPSSMADSGLSRSILIIRWPSVPACSPQRQRYPYQTHSCRWHQRPGGKRYIRHTKHSPQQKIAQAASHGQKNADSTEIGYTDAIK